MKKITHYLFAIAFIFLSTSCEKENQFNEYPAEETSSISKDLKTTGDHNDFVLDIPVINGMLSFESPEDFLEVKRIISAESNDYVIDEEGIANWQNDIGFVSMALSYEREMEAFIAAEEASDQEEYLGEIPELGVKDITLAYLLNVDGKVLVDNSLYFFNHKHEIVVTDASETKLELGLTTLETNEEEGVFVFEYIFDTFEDTPDLSAAATVPPPPSCGKYYTGQEWSSDRKVVGTIFLQLYHFVGPIVIATGSTCSPNPSGIFLDMNGTTVPSEFCINGIIWAPVAHFAPVVELVMIGKSERRNIWGNWRRHKTKMHCAAGYRVIFDAQLSSFLTGTPAGYLSTSPTSSEHTITIRRFMFPNAALGAPITFFTFPVGFDSLFKKWLMIVENTSDNLKLERKCNWP